jgi:hypothetical protein
VFILARARAVEFAAGIIPLERYFRTAKSFDQGIEETQIHPGLPPESTPRRFAFLWNVASAAATRTHEKNFSTRRGAEGSKRRDARYIGLFSNKFNNPISFFVDLFMHASRLYTYICKICCSGGFKEPLLFLLRAHLMSWNSAR